MNGVAQLPNRPMSHDEISELANDFIWNPMIQFKFWLRAADTLFTESQVYLRERNFAQAYLLLMRYSILVLNKFTEHPEYKDRENRRGVQQCQKRLPVVMDQMEELKPRLRKAYEEWSKIRAQQGARQAPTSSSAVRDPALSWNHVAQAKVLDASQNQDLAVDLASKEIRRRRQTILPDEEEHRRRTGGVWDDWEVAAEATGPQQDADDWQRQMREARGRLDGDRPRRENGIDDRPSSHVSQYRYPSISKATPLSYERRPDPMNDPYQREPRTQPPVPPKEDLRFMPPPERPRKEFDHQNLYVQPPERSSKGVSTKDDFLPNSQVYVETRPVRPPKREETPEAKVTFKPAAYLENGEPIRPVFLPLKLREEFLQIAHPNTRKNLEMCGILCGTAVNNALFITNLLIPEQKCTSDTCETVNEMAMLDYCMSKDLLIIGWIHTHPTQTCFMSSRDLHTQAGYQVMMPESIAIVCAPKDNPSWGIFRLTNPPGLPYILQCNASDTFHQHTIDNIYTSSRNPPGHVYTTDSLPFEIEDLRPK